MIIYSVTKRIFQKIKNQTDPLKNQGNQTSHCPNQWQRGRSQVTSRKKMTFSTIFNPPKVTNFQKNKKNLYLDYHKVFNPPSSLKRDVICERYQKKIILGTHDQIKHYMLLYAPEPRLSHPFPMLR